MDIRIGDHYQLKGQPRKSYVVTKIFKKMAPDGILQPVPKSYEQHPFKIHHQPIDCPWITLEHLFGESGEVCITQTNFESQFEPGARFSKIDADEAVYVDGIIATYVAGVFSSGGDGGGQLLTMQHDFRELADRFGEYIPPRYNTDGTISPGDKKMSEMYCRIDHDDHVLFSDMSNENFTIGPAFPSSKAHRFDDITIIF